MTAESLTKIFTSKKCEFSFAPENSRWLKELKASVPLQPEHLWILSSGTHRTKSVKAIAHKKEGFLLAAESANSHLQVTNKDVWLNILPTYHVGGLAIHARAFLSGSKVIEPKMLKWDPKLFCDILQKSKATLTSLVPTQVFDLVEANLPVPMCLRAVVVGGGALNETLYAKARGLGWPLLPSYGMTECGSQVATAKVSSLGGSGFPSLQPLQHIELKLAEQKIFIRSPAVCDWICTLHEEGFRTLEWAAPTGWLKTEDLGEMGPFGLKVLGRQGDLIKILGVLVNVADLESRIRILAVELGLKGQMAVVPFLDLRREHALMLVTDGEPLFSQWSLLRKRLHEKFGGPEKISTLCWVPQIPTSSLQKIKRQELLGLLSF